MEENVNLPVGDDFGDRAPFGDFGDGSDLTVGGVTDIHTTKHVGVEANFTENELYFSLVK